MSVIDERLSESAFDDWYANEHDKWLALARKDRLIVDEDGQELGSFVPFNIFMSAMAGIRREAVLHYETQLARVRELPSKWRDEANMTGDTLGCKYGITAEECAAKLEAALQSAAGSGSNQPKGDETGNNSEL